MKSSVSRVVFMILFQSNLLEIINISPIIKEDKEGDSKEDILALDTKQHYK